MTARRQCLVGDLLRTEAERDAAKRQFCAAAANAWRDPAAVGPASKRLARAERAFRSARETQVLPAVESGGGGTERTTK